MKALCETEPGDANLQAYKQHTQEAAKLQNTDPEVAWAQRKSTIRSKKQLFDRDFKLKNYVSAANQLQQMKTYTELSQVIPIIVSAPPTPNMTEGLTSVFPKLTKGDPKEPYAILMTLVSAPAWKDHAAKV